MTNLKKLLLLATVVAAAAIASASAIDIDIVDEDSMPGAILQPSDFHQVPHHLTEEVAESLFTGFIKKHRKVYESVEEHTHRFKIFTQNLHYIVKHNKQAEKGQHTFVLGITKFTDMTDQEFVDGYLMKNITYPQPGDSEYDAFNTYTPLPEASLPDNVDWTYKGCVSVARDQGYCGSCWAFAATAVAEGAIAQATGALHRLSEQQLVDCESGSHGCSGGYIHRAVAAVTSFCGLPLGSDYPYCECDKRACVANRTRISGHRTSTIVTNNVVNEAAIQSAVAERCAVGVNLHAALPAFKYYSRGILNVPNCPTTIDHSVVIVGYRAATHASIAAWRIKNSWGTHWGIDGHMWIARNKNMCGIGAFGIFGVY